MSVMVVMGTLKEVSRSDSHILKIKSFIFVLSDTYCSAYHAPISHFPSLLPSFHPSVSPGHHKVEKQTVFLYSDVRDG